MSIIDSIKQNVLVPVHKEGHPFIAIAALVTIGLAYFGSWVMWPALALTIWVVYFFRDPERVTPLREGLIISPADGRVSLITQAAPPPELEMGNTPLTRVSVFMNVFNCHVNRSPITGTLTKMVHKPGLFLNADLDKASEDNERNSLAITTPYGTFAVVQIAGLVARRIVPFAREGQGLVTGERFGMIRFGSRVDVYLPEGIKPLVAVGQIMVAGETVLADATGTEGPRAARIG